MLNFRLSRLAEWTHGELQGEDRVITAVTTDSRSVTDGALFVALVGENHDAHDFVPAAVAAGAGAVLASRPVDVGVPVVRVDDTLVALGLLAAAIREQRDATVVGITGSNGKTTVKTLTRAILSQIGPTHATVGNFNNEIGLPLTILAMPEATRYAVLEMGAGKPGDIAYLAGIGKPFVGLVNTIAPAHLERMGSLRGIAETKGAMYSALPQDGVAVINADCAFADYFRELAGDRRVITFGLDNSADVTATVTAMDAATSRFRLHVPAGDVDVVLPLAGRHNVANALAAAAIGAALDVMPDVMAAGLAQAESVVGRLDVHAMTGGWTLIDDSYNANPASVAAGIDTMLLHPGEHWLVLGDMAELGSDARELHAGLGTLARDRGVDRLFATGPLSTATVDEFGEGGGHFADRDALLAALRRDLHAGVVCLVKGSHSAAMDRVVAGLLEGGTADVA